MQLSVRYLVASPDQSVTYAACVPAATDDSLVGRADSVFVSVSFTNSSGVQAFVNASTIVPITAAPGKHLDITVCIHTNLVVAGELITLTLSNSTIQEGTTSPAVLSVRLSVAPSENISLSLRACDAVTFLSPALLQFTPGSFNTPQVVRFLVPQDMAVTGSRRVTLPPSCFQQMILFTRVCPLSSRLLLRTATLRYEHIS